MPTGNEYTAVMFGQQEQSYKQNEQESRPGGAYGQGNESTAPQPSSGQYPNTFDRATGQEPLGAQSDENPFYYPNEVYDYIKCSGPGQSYVRSERESISGEYGSCKTQPTGPYPGTNIVPSPTPSKQFSSKMSGDPKALLAATQPCVRDHATMNQSFDLNQPVATLGSHAWLRDGLATDGEDEPGNEVPVKNIKLPKRG